ncbi:hypothetical protein EJ06DRAFT_523714 [Trichodelitschia bisporula]|uniref:F-box domain-containing protein n=1 Tax=Trichodelitschia bisporula TaxID=703511 RepID=A0A6G1HPK9_9PEZI|nr:hypothetical protein EJ06DRAFT_523714 [Trichodelitschia bisporula]
MTPNLSRLPFDIIYEIGKNLDVDDVVHLRSTCRSLKAYGDVTVLCKTVVENSVPYSLEARLAREEEISYDQALLRTYRRRQAERATDFVFGQGIICSVDINMMVQIDYIHESGHRRHFSLKDALDDLPITETDHGLWSLINVSHGILTLLFEDMAHQKWLLAYEISDVKPNEHWQPRLVITPRQIFGAQRLFVRNTDKYLFYGMHSVTGSHGHHEWIIRGISLDPNHGFNKKECNVDRYGPNSSIGIQLEDFPGADIGNTNAFLIHDGYFYAVSNCSSFNVIEVDWTSCYHCVRFSISDPDPEQVDTNRYLYRRQHYEGPIDDSWNDLTLQTSEHNPSLTIVEARREWYRGGSTQARTFYRTPMSFTPSTSPTTANPDSAFAPLADSHATFMTSPTRSPWHFHPEPLHPHAPDAPPHFILAHTKFRTYLAGANAFLELVADSTCCPSAAAPCLRLRTASRRPTPPDVGVLMANPKGKGKEPARTALPDVGDYEYSPVRLWPARGAGAAHGVMNKAREKAAWSHGEVFRGAADERCVVFLAAGEGGVGGRLVCLSFDNGAGVGRWNGLGEGGLVWGEDAGREERVKRNEVVEWGGEGLDEMEVGTYEYPDAESMEWEEVETLWRWGHE